MVLNKGLIDLTIIADGAAIDPFDISVANFENQGTVETKGVLTSDKSGSFWTEGTIIVTSPTLTNLVGGQIGLNNSLLSITSANGVTNDGTITTVGSANAGGFGSIYIGGILSGSGALSLEGRSQIELASSVGSGQTIDFVGSASSLTAELRLDLPQFFSGTIDGFAHGNTIALAGIAVTGSSYTDGVLTLDEASGTVALAIPGNFISNDFVVTNKPNEADVTLLCFCANTLILTPAGQRPVQELSIGDAVVTLRGEVRPIVWTGTGQVLATPGRRTGNTPVIVRKGALADAVPSRDLRAPHQR